MKSKKELLKNWRLYPIIDDGMFPDASVFCDKFQKLIRCDIDAIQLRIKHFERIPPLSQIKKLIRKSLEKNIPVIINDRPEMALILGASGVHLGKDDMSCERARKIIGKKGIIGKTIRGVNELVAAERSGCDYTSIGPVFYSPLKSNLKNIRFSVINEVCNEAKKSVVAIGGINDSNVEKVLSQGIKTVSFMRYAVKDDQPERAINVIARKIEKQIKNGDKND